VIINFRKTEQISKTIFMSFVMLGMISILTGGCSTIQTTRYPELTSIAVRNNSGISLSDVTFRGVRTSGDKQVRMGRISPVPRGATQVFRRYSSSPPLPGRVIISWTDYYQRQYEQEISLDKILNDPDTQTKDSHIFEIRPSGRISVFKE
jgi:hypothetical protein